MFLRLSKASDRNTRSHWVTLFGVQVLFSYDTPIAFIAHNFSNGIGTQLRRANRWGPTTGRHMKEGNVKHFVEVSDEEFVRRLDEAILQGVSDTVGRRVDGS